MENKRIQQSEGLGITRAEGNGGFFDRGVEILRILEAEASRKSAVIIEGPPIYLWPPQSAQFESLQWENDSFKGGWEFVCKLSDVLPENKTYQYVLIDDLNYSTSHDEIRDTGQQLDELRRSSVALADSALFKPDSRQIRKFSESELAFKQNTTVCSQLDAAFNVRKIVDQLGYYGGNASVRPESIEKIMNIVVNPDTPVIRAEQLNMFNELYKQLRKDPAYARVSKDQARKAITETYRHVWVGEKGNIKGVTRTVFANNNFLFVNR